MRSHPLKSEGLSLQSPCDWYVRRFSSFSFCVNPVVASVVCRNPAEHAVCSETCRKAHLCGLDDNMAERDCTIWCLHADAVTQFAAAPICVGSCEQDDSCSACCASACLSPNSAGAWEQTLVDVAAAVDLHMSKPPTKMVGAMLLGGCLCGLFACCAV
jgi:hypothetical protein